MYNHKVIIYNIIMSKNLIPRKLIIFIFLVAYEIIVGIISLYLGLNALLYILLSWILPTFFFLYKLRLKRSGYIFEALMWSIPSSILIDWIGHYSKAWNYWDNQLFASTGIDIFGIPLESFVWGSAFWIFFVMVYEYFFDENRFPTFKNKEKLMALSITAFSLFVVFLINFYKPAIPYFYSIILCFLTLIIIFFLKPYKHLIVRMIKFGFVSFTLGILVEFFSLKLNLWSFSVEWSIKEILFFGHLIPLEEIIWWFIVPMAIATVHEIFADNQK